MVQLTHPDKCPNADVRDGLVLAEGHTRQHGHRAKQQTTESEDLPQIQLEPCVFD